VIERADDRDLNRLNELVAQLRPDIGEPAFDPALVRQEQRTFVARAPDGTATGFIVAAYIDIGIPDEGGATIELLVVDEAERGGGTGAALVRHALQWLAGEGIDTVFVSTSADGDAAGFYERLGFARCRGPWLVRSTS